MSLSLAIPELVFFPSGVSASMVKSYQSDSQCQSAVTCTSSYPAALAMSMTCRFS